ncbi:SDR family NAD(P)-dependent oxidoreductase [Paraburkholderia sp. Ac-20347]|uniref:SDR family NAD(P)-dependent oxidoreductase n=1 Tax=Paraburkholderia sp. Ac-20347 TaxID=2703892 RepID=UPI00197E1D6D|nr:SDR family NAD(P)-dependent oxidoreductase [Paraburkholderia sp. Ac-20347]MBN3812509.1 SDR family oxidoreductase [Paraburkholderia sp. Ac-20347]
MTAVITGAGSGVGAEIARVFHAEGAVVVLNDLDAHTLGATADELGSRVHVHRGDVTKSADLDRLAAWAQELAGGAVQILVNNAGSTIRGTLEETTEDIFRSAIEVNLGSAIQLTRRLAPAMKFARRGSIINMASITSLSGLEGAVAYTASKAGMTGVTRALAAELAPFGVRVNAVCPGVIDTPMTYAHADIQADPATHYEMLKRRQPMNRMASARDCALATLFLAEPASSFITGVFLPVDGGRQAM